MQRIEKGFSLVAIIAMLALIGSITASAWYVWQSKQNINSISNTSTNTENQQKDSSDDVSEEIPAESNEVEDWLVFTSTAGWQLSIPDGWKLYTDEDSKGLTAYSTLNHTPGTKAVVEQISSGRGGPFIFNTGTYAAGDPATQHPDYLTEESVFEAQNVKGRRYSGTLNEDIPMGASKGDTVYWYIFTKDTKTVIFQYTKFKDSESVLYDVERALSTLNFY
jgi:type II secretory pathway pseudopilin PulG